MATRFLVCVPAILVFTAAFGLAQDGTAQKADLEQQINQLKVENEKLRGQVEDIDAKVQDVLDNQSAEEETALDRFYSMAVQDEMYESGVIKKGGLTGTLDKLLSLNPEDRQATLAAYGMSARVPTHPSAYSIRLRASSAS